MGYPIEILTFSFALRPASIRKNRSRSFAERATLIWVVARAVFSETTAGNLHLSTMYVHYLVVAYVAFIVIAKHKFLNVCELNELGNVLLFCQYKSEVQKGYLP